MEQTQKEDLRVRKTRQAIRNTLKEMIYEMNYEQITIKELTARARINRKTFYLHYRDLSELFSELEQEIADTFIKNTLSYGTMTDNRALVRLVFETTGHMPLYYERILCSGSYRGVCEKISEIIMEHRKKTNWGTFGLDEYAENLVFAYCGSNALTLYRQWVADGKKLPMEEVIALATTLICQGLSGVVSEE